MHHEVHSSSTLLLAGIALTTACLLGVLPPIVLMADAATRQQSRGEAAVTILHTGDLHGHVMPWIGWEGDLEGRTVGGLDRIAGLVNSVRDEVGRDRVIVLDSGDAVGDTMPAALTRGAVIIDAMNAIGYDAMTFGNHEPDFGIPRLRELMQNARFPFLAVNIHEDPAGTLFAKPYTMLERGGIKVGVVGLAYANTPMTTARKNVAGVKFSHAPEAIGRAVQELRQRGADLLVVLSHAGLAGDQKLASMVPGIDVIVGGHSHNRVDEPLKAGATLIVSAGSHGSHVGRLDLRVQNGRIASHERRLIAVDHATVKSDPKVSELIERALAPHRKALEERAGEAGARIVRAQTLAGPEPEKRDALSPADVLFADILREHAKADVALLPGVGYGVAINPGPITAGDLRNLIPHESKIVTVTLTGRQVREILEQAVQNVYTETLKEKVGGMIQVSGIRFTYDTSKPDRQRVTEVRVGDAQLEDDGTYKVVTNSMLAEGGHNYRTFLHGKDRQEGAEVYEVVKAWLSKAGPVKPPPTDAITKTPAR